ncbi:sensor histidine kinase [Nocardiopsis algeriensis]|uniref:histidine kinase n=1 Tax=Nocardiopsis algeriensis TaxID=1478215 RepID=A0A841IPM0_9ACTN|nr:histidine kinase [Nocardiopsis algeriensis]MBB6120613.1 signal transduction histidine kinase [Nocardiopsis algeriensis]
MIDRLRIPEPWRRFGGTAWPFPLALLLLVASFLPALHNNGTQLGGMPDRPFDALAVVAIALQCLPLAVSRRWPLLCLVLVVLGFTVDQLQGYHSLAGTALPVALLNAGFRLERYRGATTLLLSLAYVPLALVLFRFGSGETPAGFVMFYIALVLAWVLGTWLRSVRAAEAERRRRVAEDTRTAERTRIARELHDVVTHHVTAMVVQAEAARYLTAAPDRLDQSLSAVTDTGRQAISDLRHLLDLLNPDHGAETATPMAGRILPLVEQTRRAGQPVEFVEEGTPADSAGSAGFVAHRVVQEALTNALKHAHGSPTSVEVHHGEEEITVEVGTDGPGTPAGSPAGSGRGLAGLRERVDALGGDFTAGRRADGGFAVRARIPVEGRP